MATTPVAVIPKQAHPEPGDAEADAQRLPDPLAQAEIESVHDQGQDCNCNNLHPYAATVRHPGGRSRQSTL